MEGYYKTHVEFLQGKADSYNNLTDQVLQQVGLLSTIKDVPTMKMYIVLLNRKLNELIGLFMSANLSESQSSIILKQSHLVEFVCTPVIPSLLSIKSDETRKATLAWLLRISELLLLNTPWKVEMMADRETVETIYHLRVKQEDLPEQFE